ncbi:hypothetical protein JIY74_34610 [Vibrio harveyi]|nr:hypothetical protein [Vibrio harveyi]CRH24736.1 Uncharacterised protein [Chlamydia trachomatis]
MIQNILKLAYPNEDARNSYIEFEKQIDSQKQVQRLKNDFFYYSYIRTETAAYNEESKPLFYIKSRNDIFETIRND